jgi:hypothetical protein
MQQIELHSSQTRLAAAAFHLVLLRHGEPLQAWECLVVDNEAGAPSRLLCCHRCLRTRAQTGEFMLHCALAHVGLQCVLLRSRRCCLLLAPAEECAASSCSSSAVVVHACTADVIVHLLCGCAVLFIHERRRAPPRAASASRAHTLTALALSLRVALQHGRNGLAGRRRP